MAKSKEQEAIEYQDRMDFPMENLAIAMWGVAGGGPAGIGDHEIVEIAARKINTLKKMVLATGFSEQMLKAIMEE
jgi:hypothetical protein